MIDTAKEILTNIKWFGMETRLVLRSITFIRADCICEKIGVKLHFGTKTLQSVSGQSCLEGQIAFVKNWVQNAFCN